MSEALAYQIMYQVQVDISCIEAIMKIAKDVGIPPHMPETRNVFYPMWQRSRKMSTLPYREFLRQALELDWNESLTTALSDSIFVIQELMTLNISICCLNSGE
ncbi:MAG: hypothetical protein C7B47_07665 [Sulfobacillus thermosulfidooxidans]|uniref:Uncharacterized protein n=1 Tax=Sulfobacillus thermosulfidooxidans TaxID=28034 RepID=A0A2T2WZP2_SULTH|nr:MAG: hypothetical protein C7B47_07665 [Sulfobacillus thermosulfidooxidans]